MLLMLWTQTALGATATKTEMLQGDHFFNVDKVYEATPEKSKAQGAIEAVRLCKSKGGKFVQAFYIKQSGKDHFRLTDVFCHEKRWSNEIHELARAVIMRSRVERGLSVHRDGLALIDKLNDTNIDGYSSTDISPAAGPMEETTGL